MTPDIWYRSYDAYNSRIAELREALRKRCEDLEVDAKQILAEFTRESHARAVHESNWQEGIELERGKTQKLESIAFDELEDIKGPHLDMNKVLRFHRDAVVQMKKKGMSQEEIGAYNLARAHHVIEWVGSDLATRMAAGLIKALKEIRPVFESARKEISQKKNTKNVEPDYLDKVNTGFALVEELEADKSAIWMPMTAPPKDQGDMLRSLVGLDSDHLLSPMKTTYVHFFHRLVLMGIMPAPQCGRYRKGAVHVGNSDLYFPSPGAVSQMMREFCRNFPPILPNCAKYDPIIVAAKVSHHFVSIHPYEDGNGRVSRLLMNLVLWGHHPPVALKADKKGRHKYSQALRKADHGDIKPLAALIAMSIVEMYEKLLRSLGQY